MMMEATGNPGGMTDDEVAFVVNPDTSTELRYNYDKKLETTGSGVVVTGILTATSYRGDGSQLTGVLAASEGGISVQDDQSLVGVSTHRLWYWTFSISSVWVLLLLLVILG